MDCSSPGSSVHGILQAKRLEWVGMPSSRGSSRPRDWTHFCSVFLLPATWDRWDLCPLWGHSHHLGPLKVLPSPIFQVLAQKPSQAIHAKMVYQAHTCTHPSGFHCPGLFLCSTSHHLKSYDWISYFIVILSSLAWWESSTMEVGTIFVFHKVGLLDP